MASVDQEPSSRPTRVCRPRTSCGRATATREACFPFNVAAPLPFYRARNAIYHLFRALVAQPTRA